ncbi:MAG: hypothetical protein ACOX8Q_08410 [Christensenellales bacterium]
MKPFGHLRDLLKNHAKLLSNAIVFTLIAGVFVVLQSGSIANANGNPDNPKSETVYAVLGNDGSYSGATVVNCFTQGGEIVDYGLYTSIENLTGPDSPITNGDQIIWPAASTEGLASFYYQGETQKPLPFTVGITYYLNGQELPPEKIAGKTGELKIKFVIVNNTGTGEKSRLAGREVYTPFAIQVSLTLDNNIYTVLKIPQNASSVLAGSSITLSYSSFPLPEDTFSFTLFGKNIELEPIRMIALPKSPPGLDSYGDFVDVDGLSSGTDKMIDGADDMHQGTVALLDALYQLKDAAKHLKNGLDGLDSGTHDLSYGAEQIFTSADALKAAAGEFYSGMEFFAASFASFDQSMGLLDANMQDAAEALLRLSDAATMLNSGVTGLGGGIEDVSLLNAQLKALSDTVAATYPADPNAAGLAAGLQAQQAAIGGLISTCGDLEALSASVKSGTQDFYTEFTATLCSCVSGLREGSGTLYASCIDLLSGAYNIDIACSQICGALRDLKLGIRKLSGGIGDAASVMPELSGAIDEMIGGTKDLEAGIASLNENGLKGLKDTFDGLDEYLQALSRMADEYGSFTDLRNAKTSTVQFILKTAGIFVLADE